MSTRPSIPDLEALSHEADPEADEQIAELFAFAPEERRFELLAGLLDEMLRWKPGTDAAPPTALAKQLEQPVDLPEWVVPGGGLERLERAQRLLAERESATFVVLAFASLPACYRQPEIAELLASTGRLSVQVFRRLRETADFVAEVTRPGAFRAGGLGFVWCRKVRLVHAIMRAIARMTPPDTASETGGELQDFLLRRRFAQGDPQPIDQTELAFVLQTFGYLGVRGMRTLRIQLSDEEADSVIFLWSVVGSFLGICDELLPLPDPGRAQPSLVDQARRLYEGLDDHNRERAEVPDSGRLLTAALIVSMRGAMRRAVPRLEALRDELGAANPLRWIPLSVTRWIDQRIDTVISSAPRSFIRLLLGRRAAQELGVGRAPLLHYLGHQVAFALAGAMPLDALAGAGPRRSWARTPAEFWRRGAALRIGQCVDEWRREPPAAFLGS